MDDVSPSSMYYVLGTIRRRDTFLGRYGHKLFLLCRADDRCRRGTFRKAEFTTLGDISIGRHAVHESQRIERKTQVLSRAIAIGAQYSIAVKLERWRHWLPPLNSSDVHTYVVFSSVVVPVTSSVQLSIAFRDSVSLSTGIRVYRVVYRHNHSLSRFASASDKAR